MSVWTIIIGTHKFANSDVLLTAHLSIILVNDKLDAQILVL